MDLRKLKTLIELVETSGLPNSRYRRARNGFDHALGAPGAAATTTTVQLPLGASLAAPAGQAAGAGTAALAPQ
jgi:hypothetical protein